MTISKRLRQRINDTVFKSCSQCKTAPGHFECKEKPNKNGKCKRHPYFIFDSSRAATVLMLGIMHLLYSSNSLTAWAFAPSFKNQPLHTAIDVTSSRRTPPLHRFPRSIQDASSFPLLEQEYSHPVTTSSSSSSFGSRRHSFNSRKSNFKLTPSEIQALFQTYQQYKVIREYLLEQNLMSEPLSLQASKLNLSPSVLQSILSAGYQARQTLLLANVPLVRHTVKKITNAQNLFSSMLSVEDLVQEGTIGLTKAIDKFDYRLGNKFSTYAVYWIRASVLRFIQQKEELIRVPEYMEKAIRVLDGFLDAERMQRGEEVMVVGLVENEKDDLDLEHVAKVTGLGENVIREAFRVKQRRQVLYSKREAYRELEDYMLEASNGSALQYSEDVKSSMECSEHKEHVKDVLGQFLSMKEMEALSWRYGLLEEEEEQLRQQQQQLQQQQQQLQQQLPQQQQLQLQLQERDRQHQYSRDYEAEAENYLFGPNGILSSSKGKVSDEKKKMERYNNPYSNVTKRSICIKKGGRWGEAMSFQEVGEHMRVSAEYGRRLCSSALKKLKAAAEEGRLDPAMLF